MERSIITVDSYVLGNKVDPRICKMVTHIIYLGLEISLSSDVCNYETK